MTFAFDLYTFGPFILTALLSTPLAALGALGYWALGERDDDEQD